MNSRPVVHIYPKGTYKTPPFYFRGSEPLTEPEYLTKQLSIYRENYRKSKKELDAARAEFNQISANLSQKDGYTVALASALGKESNTTEENAKLRYKLADLTTKIESVERNIKYYKGQQSNFLVSGLIREKAYYHAEIENRRLEIYEGIENIRNSKAALGQIVSSERYSQVLHTMAQHSAVRQLHHKLKSDVNQLFKDFNDKPSPKNSKHPQQVENTEIKNLYEQKYVLGIELNEIRNEKYYTEALNKFTSLAMIDQIEAMNQVLVSLGGEPLNVDDLRAEINPPNETAEADNQEGNGNPDSSPKSKSMKMIKKREVSTPSPTKLRPKSRTKGGLPTNRRPRSAYGERK